MTYFSRMARTLLALIGIADLALFSSLTTLTLLALAIGAAVIVLGLQYSYRPAAVLGLLIAATGAAASTEIATVLEVGPLFAALFGLLIPVILLTWIAFSAGEEQDKGSSLGRREVGITFVYAGLSLAAAPVVSLLVSFAFPVISMRFTTATEIAIMLLVLISGGMLLTREKTATRTLSVELKKGPG